MIDGGIQLIWERTSDRPFSFSTEYRWKAADTVDMTLVFTPDTDLQNFELFIGSYFNKFSKGAVYTQDSGSGKPGFTETPADKGVTQLFPRNETVLGLVRDGRWTFPPFPNNWAIRTALQAPLALGKDNNTGVTVLLMSPPEDCFAVSSAFNDQGLFALYLSLFGKDVKKNESLIGRARLVFGKNTSDEKAIEAYQKYLSEAEKPSTAKTEPAPGETKGPSVTESQSQQTSNDRDVATNTLTNAEKAAGWKLLFDGKTTKGWRNYKKQSVGPGWKVENGTLIRAEEGAEDIITVDEYDAFELTIDYDISKGGNSGIMYHVTESGRWPYVTGPEIQIQDNKDGQDSQKSGWLYELYSSPNDATKPAGTWNTIRILITPEKCQTFMNGQKYYEYVKGSDDWNKRVAKSKFPRFGDDFGKPAKGHICLQDHGNVVSFRNIKIRPIADYQSEQQKPKQESTKHPSTVKKTAPRKLPPAAKALGYTKCVIDEKPVAEDVTMEKTGDHKWFSGDFWLDQPTLDHYKNARGKLAINLNGFIVNRSLDCKQSKLPLLPGADGFYIEIDTQVSDNDQDHYTTLYLMPNEHNRAEDPSNWDHYPGDPERFERWMELDVDESGHTGQYPGVTFAVISSTGIAPDIKHVINPNNGVKLPLDRTKMNTFGAAYDPKRRSVSWWLNGKFMMEAAPEYVPEIGAKQNFYLLIAASARPKQVPYTMYLGGVRAFVPPTSTLPEVDVPVIAPKTNAGTLVLTVSEPNADVQVLTKDGRVEDTRLVEKKSESIVIDAGKHQLKVWKNGFHLFTENFTVEANGKKSITAKLAPVVKKLDGRVTPNEHWNSPAFQNWVDYVRSMPARQQIDAVEKKLMELNPGFYGKLSSPRNAHAIPWIEDNGYVSELAIVADYVTDISPVRVFNLFALKCVGTKPGNAFFSDLSPLKGMQLTKLEVWNTQVKDLSPLEGMPLELLGIGATPVSDLSSLKLASQSRWGPFPLKVKLFCDKTPISDLSPLQGLQLQSLFFTPKNIAAGIDVIRQMKSIESIGAEGQAMTTPEEFWKKYDAGEFSKSK